MSDLDLSPIPVSNRLGWFIRPWTLDEAIDRDAEITAFNKAKDTKGKVAYILANSLVGEDGQPIGTPEDFRKMRGGVVGPLVIKVLDTQGLNPVAEKND